jgi:hypothetical protein
MWGARTQPDNGSLQRTAARYEDEEDAAPMAIKLGAVEELTEPDHRKRNHQGCDNQLIESSGIEAAGHGRQ